MISTFIRGNGRRKEGGSMREKRGLMSGRVLPLRPPGKEKWGKKKREQ